MRSCICGLMVRDARHCRAPHHEGFRRHPESLTENAASIFRLFTNRLKMTAFFVMAGLVPAIHAFLA
jgi:hypothetical protein